MKWDRGELRSALGLVALAWLHRLLLLVANRDRAWPFTIFYEGDSEAFYRYARALLAGELYDHGIPFHPPGFAWLLAGLHTLVGAGGAGDAVPHLAVKCILALVGALGVGLLYLLVRPYLGATVALVAALLASWHFGLAVLAIAPVTEGTYLTILLAALLLWSRRFSHPLAAPGAEPAKGFGPALLLGATFGGLALVRAEGALVAAAALAVGLWGLRRQAQGRWKPWAFVVLGGVLVVTPWAIRNALRLADIEARLGPRLAEPLPRFVPLTLYGPINLALANNPGATGGFSRAYLASRSDAAVLDLADPQHLEFVLHGDRLAWRWARENPRTWLRLAGRKVELFFGAFRLGWTQWNLPGGLTGIRRPVDVFVPKSRLGWWLHLPLAGLGLGFLLFTPGAPRRWGVIVLALTVLGLAVTVAFFGYARLGLLVLPFWLTGTATALVTLASGRLRLPAPAEPSRPLRRCLFGLVATLLLIETWGASHDRNYRATGTNVPGQTYLDRDAPVELEVMP